MVSCVRDERGFTFIEMVVLIVITGVLAAIAIPKYADLQERATKAEAQVLLGAGRAAILLHFSDNVVNTGQYLVELTDATTAPGVFDPTDVTDLENRLQTPPTYPPQGRYDHPPNKGFRWYLVTQGCTSPARPPLIDAIIDLTCDVADSAKSKKDDDCFVSRL